MFQISVILKDTALQQPVLLLFGKKENFERAVSTFNEANKEARLKIEDDYGQAFNGFRYDIAGILVADLMISRNGMIEHMLHQQHTQLSFQTRVENDPAIKAAVSRQRLVEPMGMPPSFNTGRN